MTTAKPNSTTGSTDSDLPPESVFELLADDRRRRAMSYLLRSVGAVHVGRIADQLALLKGEHTYERYERICTALVHIHLPKLEDAGIVRYHPDDETVALLDAADQLVSHLELAGAADGR